MGDYMIGEGNAGRQRVDIPDCAKTSHDGLPQKRLEEDRRRIAPCVPRADKMG